MRESDPTKTETETETAFDINQFRESDPTKTGTESVSDINQFRESDQTKTGNETGTAFNINQFRDETISVVRPLPIKLPLSSTFGRLGPAEIGENCLSTNSQLQAKMSSLSSGKAENLPMTGKVEFIASNLVPYCTFNLNKKHCKNKFILILCIN